MSPFPIIRPLLVPWRGAGGDEAFCCCSLISGPVSFFDGRLSLALGFLLSVVLGPTLGADPNACSYCIRAATSFLTKGLYLPMSISKKALRWVMRTGGVKTEVDGQMNLWWWEEACNRRVMGVVFGPPQNAWRVSRVTKSFHFLSSRGIVQTLLRKVSCSLVILGWTWAKSQKEQKVRCTIEVDRATKRDTDDTPNSLTIPQVLLNPSGLPSHFSSLHTHFVPLTKKYLFFQFLLDFGMSDTNLSDDFLAKKW